MLWLLDLLMLFFPSNCLMCGKRLSAPGAVLCLVCELKLPRTGDVNAHTKPVSQIFWGRVPVQAGFSLLEFEKGSVFQTLIHELKYRGNMRAGLYLGQLLGQELKRFAFPSCDLLVPVPLHKKRYKERGYNQSELIARGISGITGIPVDCHLIKRSRYQRSQTSMTRHERFENIDSAFSLCNHSRDLQEKKILIIDDIITTGATLEACSRVLISHHKCLIYIATVSFA